MLLRCFQQGIRNNDLSMMPREWSDKNQSYIQQIKDCTTERKSLNRLELLAVLIGNRSINFITQSLQLKIHWKTIWTDSLRVLHWLKSKKILTPFVQRRIDEIQSNKGVEFRYVSTTQNPVDIASRGCTVKIRNGNEFWWHGPTWLKKYHDNWPTWNVNIDSSITQELRKSEEIGLMMKNSSKKRKQWTCMYSLKQESVS